MTINNGVGAQKPLKVREASQSQQDQQQEPEQEGPLNMENFDYEIPYTPSTEVLLHTIIVKQEWTNKKIYYLAWKLAEIQILMLSRLFRDDDENTKQSLIACFILFIFFFSFFALSTFLL